MSFAAIVRDGLKRVGVVADSPVPTLLLDGECLLERPAARLHDGRARAFERITGILALNLSLGFDPKSGATQRPTSRTPACPSKQGQFRLVERVPDGRAASS